MSHIEIAFLCLDAKALFKVCFSASSVLAQQLTPLPDNLAQKIQPMTCTSTPPITNWLSAPQETHALTIGTFTRSNYTSSQYIHSCTQQLKISPLMQETFCPNLITFLPWYHYTPPTSFWFQTNSDFLGSRLHTLSFCKDHSRHGRGVAIYALNYLVHNISLKLPGTHFCISVFNAKVLFALEFLQRNYGQRLLATWLNWSKLQHGFLLPRSTIRP